MKEILMYRKGTTLFFGLLPLFFLTGFITFKTNNQRVIPAIVTQKVFGDSDDPAIWINYNDPRKSLILGTDKNDHNGGIYVFNLTGEIDSNLTRTGMKRVNNVDIIQRVAWSDSLIDLVVVTERGENQLRIFELPSMRPLDGGGIPVFIGEKERSPMGVAFYKRRTDNALFVIVSRKNGPTGTYLWQYRLKQGKKGQIEAVVSRKFGKFSGFKEIESIAVDTLFEHIYYSDEQNGIRKYFADPLKGDEELAVFGKSDFKEDNEGISFYHLSDSTGYILVSDQGANQFQIYNLDTGVGGINTHKLITTIPVSTLESDGSDCTSFSLPGFEKGMFVAMSADRTFHFYRWIDFVSQSNQQLKSR
ncbi:MAG: phytase [Chitinophagaceae bacterium]|jgi:3-phytase